MKLTTISFKKTIDIDNRVIHFLMNNQIPAEDYYNYLDCAGLRKLRKMVFLSYRRLEEIINLSGEELYELIKELTGAKEYEEKRNETETILEKTEIEQKRNDELLVEIRDKLELLRKNMREYEQFEKNTEEINSIQKIINERKLFDLEEKLEKITKKEAEERMAILLSEPKLEELLKENDEKVEIIKTAESYLEKCEKMKEKGLLGQSHFEAMTDDSMKSIDEKASLGKKIAEEIKLIENKIIELEKDKTVINQELSKLEMKAQHNKAISDLAAPQFHGKTGQNALEQKKKDFLQNEKNLHDKIEKLNSKINAIKEESMNFNTTIAENDGIHENNHEKLKAKTKELSELSKIIRPIIEEHNDIHFQTSSLEEKFIQIFDILMKDIGISKQRKNGIDIIHLINITRLFSTRNQGKFASIFIDLVSIRDSLKIPLESLYLYKLFAIVVEDEEGVEEIIRINKELKGGRISIKALSTIPVDQNSSMLINTSILQKENNETYENELHKKRVIFLRDWVNMKNIDPFENKYGFFENIYCNRLLTPKLNKYLESVHNSGLGIYESFMNFLEFSFRNSRSKQNNLDVSLLDKTEFGEFSETSINYLGRFQAKIESLIEKTIKKGAIVLTLEDGQKIASEKGFHCSTQEGEIVFSGGYLAKVGYQCASKNFLFLYDKIGTAFHNLKVVSDELVQILKKKIIVDKKKQELEKRINGCEIDKNRIETEGSMNDTDINFLKEQIFKRKINLAGLESEMEKKLMEVRLNKKNIEMIESVKESGGKNIEKLLKAESSNEMTFSEDLKKISGKLKKIDDEIAAYKHKHSMKLKNKELIILEAGNKNRKVIKIDVEKYNSGLKNENNHMKEKRIFIENEQKKYVEIQKVLKIKKDEIEVKRHQHATVLAQKENYQQRILELKIAIVN